MDEKTFHECIQAEQEAINEIVTAVLAFVIELDARREELEQLVNKIHTMVQRNA